MCFPIGLDWSLLIKRGIVKPPKFKLYLVKDRKEKVKKVEELLSIPLKTVIFCDSIEFGRSLSRKLGIPFVYGETRKRIEKIRQAQHCIVSRVGDEGISLPDIERIIEIDFQFGSRRQESQRFGRLMHAVGEGTQYIILMTEGEFESYQKRLYAITERGFRIEVVR